MKQSRNSGFTLVELMIVTTIVVIIMTVSVMAYKQGFSREYALSQQTRTLATALQLARMGALESKNTITISNAQSMDKLGSSAWFRKIEFTASDHGVKTGDYVAVAGLKTAVSTDTLSAGTFYTSSVTSNTFQCVFYHSDSVMTPVAPNVAIARNLTRTAQLSIQKKGQADLIPESQRNAFEAARAKNQQIFVYDNKNFIIWDPNDVAASVDTAALTYSPVPSFNSRGFSSNETGFELRIAPIPSKPDGFKIIRISPFGQVGMGKR